MNILCFITMYDHINVWIIKHLVNMCHSHLVLDIDRYAMVADDQLCHR